MMNIELGNKSNSTYNKVRSVDASQEPIDLFIFDAGASHLVVGTPKVWFKLDRPLELSSVPLPTWSLLTTGVTEHHHDMVKFGARNYGHYFYPGLKIFLLAVGLCFLLDTLLDDEKIQVKIMMIVIIGLVVAFVHDFFFLRNRMLQYVEEVYHPSIQSVLRELEGPLVEAGFEVQLVVETDKAFEDKPLKSFLRCVQILDDDNDVDAMEAATQ